MKNKLSMSITAILVAGLLAAGVCCTGFASRDEYGAWFKNSNLLTWHWDDPANEDENDNEDGESGLSAMAFGIPVEDYEAYGVSSQAIQAEYIVVSFEPPETTDQRVNFAFAWENPNSEWARGKDLSDYMGYTAGANYSSTCSVWATQAYAETIICTVSSYANPALKDTVRLEYVARPSSSLSAGDVRLYLEDPQDAGFDFGHLLDSINFGTGTIMPTTYRIGDVGFVASQDYESFVSDYQIDCFDYINPHFILTFGDFVSLTEDGAWGHMIDEYLYFGASSYVGTFYISLDFYYGGVKIYNSNCALAFNFTQEFLDYFSVPANSLSASKDIYF